MWLGPGQPVEGRPAGLPAQVGRVGLLRHRRRLLDARAVFERQLVPRVDDRVLSRPRAGHEDRARPLAGSDERVLRPGRAVHEVPRFQVPVLALDQEQALAVEDEEVLLVRLAVVAASGLARLEDGDREAELRPALQVLVLEHAGVAERGARHPVGVADVDDEPALARGREPAGRLLEPRLLDHDGQASASLRRVGSSASGSTFTSASPGMKLVSPPQRGTACRWTWSIPPAPAARPMFQPRLKPCGSAVRRSASSACVASRWISSASLSESPPNSPTWPKGATITWPDEYGYLFSRQKASSPRW